MALPNVPAITNLRLAIEGLNSPTNLATSTVSLPTATGTTFFVTVTNKAGAVTFTVPDVSVYMDNTSTTNNLLPFGYSTDPTKWIVYICNDWAQTDNINTVTRIFVYNNTGSTHSIILKYVGRVISNTLTTGE